MTPLVVLIDIDAYWYGPRAEFYRYFPKAMQSSHLAEHFRRCDEVMTRLCCHAQAQLDGSVLQIHYMTDHPKPLRGVKPDYLNDESALAKHSPLYLCGVSLDQCVMARPCGYFGELNKGREDVHIVLDGCIQHMPLTPIDWAKYGKPYRQSAPEDYFSSLEEIEAYRFAFAKANGVRTVLVDDIVN